ncbi:MAG: Rab family GTPase [Candidatus Ranarchaeia archaeon]
MVDPLPKTVYKIVIVGDNGIGKTCLTRYFTTGMFSSEYKMTVGLQISSRVLELNPDPVKLVIWDTAGQDHFSAIRPRYYSGAAGAVIGFDLTRRKTLDHVPKWISETRDVCPHIPLVLAGLKADLRPQLSRLAIREIADTFDLPVIYASSKIGSHVDTVFEKLVEMIQEKTVHYQGATLKL